MMWWDDGRWGPGNWLLMGLLMIVFWGGLIALAVWLTRIVRTDRSLPRAAQSHGARADEVLAERFASGEIDEEDFKRRRDLLRSGGR